MSYKMILVDDHHIVRQGLRFLIDTVEDFEILEDFSSGHQLLEYLKDNDLPDVVLLDLVMPEMNGIEITGIVKSQYPNIKILVLTSFYDEEHVISALDKGADGYEIKDVEPEALIQTIRAVLNGEKKIHPKVQSIISESTQKPHRENKLSKRELEVLSEMVKGNTNKEIAETLFVSEKTIKTHVSHILNKLKVSDRTQAAVYAMEHHLIN
ncbi:response regulator transcription factor [Mammaliicoccus sp. Dog046]|uniref:response regulator transcription factor n=1 Tax=Mammaliicoccus sp. Dog046 TaxID=3034233 RepID=UPI002B25BC52|nr:response regulator transcription factor [Mammaliicoccus sp. Dog046]WQK86316.1 response regulator transcription factor [Mammaliicoccus sp. Dog046]